jgi:hypothetical protein
MLRQHTDSKILAAGGFDPASNCEDAVEAILTTRSPKGSGSFLPQILALNRKTPHVCQGDADDFARRHNLKVLPLGERARVATACPAPPAAVQKSKAIVSGIGLPCPKCHKPMQRKRHPEGWKPKDKWYFEQWDVCTPCGHVQHYNEFRREPPVGADPVNELEAARANDRVISDILGIPPAPSTNFQSNHHARSLPVTEQRVTTCRRCGIDSGPNVTAPVVDSVTQSPTDLHDGMMVS